MEWTSTQRGKLLYLLSKLGIKTKNVPNGLMFQDPVGVIYIWSADQTYWMKIANVTEIEPT